MVWRRFFDQINSKLFWRLGLVYLALLLLVLIAVDTYTVQALRHDIVQSAFERLDSLAGIAQSRLPSVRNTSELAAWAAWMSRSGVRCTVVALDGKVLADSEADPRNMENHATRAEIREAREFGRGEAIRHSDTIGKDLVYLAIRHQDPVDASVIVRFALPLHRLDAAVAAFRWRLWTASAIILVVAGGLSLYFFRALTERINRLKLFSRRVAGGDFRPLPTDLKLDELTDLGSTLNETAAHLDRTIRSLTTERNQAAAILRSMVEGVAVISPNRRLTFCNESFCRVLGVDGSSWPMRPMAEVIRQSDLLEAIQKALEGNETVQSELVVGTVRTRSFAVTAAPVRSDGATAGAVMVLHDISELRRLERARRDFVANISHEFKTPLTAIQGFAETLLGGALEDLKKRTHFLEIIRGNAVRLERLTSDLLRLSQIEAGQLHLDLRQVAVADVINPCIESARVNAASKRLTLDVDCSPTLPAIRGDVNSLQEILQNLLDNAVRYTPPDGRITVRATVADGAFVLSVADTGIGIPKEFQERIFERFYRVDAARSRELGGTGLGLSIAKHLAELHGGRIDLESQVGLGSTFSVVLPGA
jgi:two-component system phosphate regulon sensor histidine kinase PhoR